MEKIPPVFKEYEVIPKSQFLKLNDQYYCEKDWSELCRYSIFLREWAKKGDVEEQPGPEGDNIKFGGFVGSYHLNSGKDFIIKLDEDKLNDKEYDMILEDVIEWCHILGPNFYSKFNFSNPLHEFEKILSYSNHLIDMTELASATYLSPIIEHVTKTSPTIHGRMNIPKTTRHFIQSQTLIVSKKTKLKIDTLPILLLVRFNYELSKVVQLYLETLNQKKGIEEYKVQTSFEKILSKNLSYHHTFLLNPRNHRLVQSSLDIDFYDPIVLSEAIKQSNGNTVYQDLILLWEGYSSDRSLEASFDENLRGGYSLKPISKIYEIWVLRKIYTILSEIFGEPEITYGDEGMILYFRGEKNVELPYNYNIGKISKFDKMPSELYPDYLLNYYDGRKKVVLTLDAKYKTSVSSSDVQQIMAYMLVTGWGEKEDHMFGALLYVGSRYRNNELTTYSRSGPNAQIKKICIRPGFDEGFNDLRNMLFTSLGLH